MNVKSLFLLGLVLVAGQAFAAPAERWYSDEQVAQGEKLFRQNCAGCHGQNAEATPDWKKTDANGNYPPPPLNGSAHTWHHDLDLLRRTIREGGAKLGGQMPAFEGVLNAEQVDAVIAFFQSKWSDEIYQRWSGRFVSDDLPSLNDIVVANKNPLTRLLRQRIGNAPIDDVSETSVADVWQVQIGNQYVYLLDNGKYALMGDLVDLESGRNLTEISRRVTVVETISEFNDKDLIIYPAQGEARATLNVFTDTSCPYCQKMHGEISQLQAAGITVRYLPYARGGQNGPGYETMKSVWCADDRNQAMTDAKSNRFDDLPQGDCAQAAMIDRGYRAGNQVGIRGTPALIKSNGEKIEGYVPYRELIPMLLQ
ncbi:MAG: thioredoxin fold domain-containing protein [Gammaproteobacteria bacterium]|nr:MAG: thioredoxin fold domain-containing protein [Gammaproteobacteria bacterium]